MNTQNKSVLFPILLLVTAIAMLGMVGCDSKSTLDGDSSSSSVTINTPQSSLDVSGTMVVEAVVVSGTAGVADQVVTFSVSPSNAGYFSPAVDTTDGSGIAVTTFTATTSGSAQFTASVNGTTTVGTASITINSTAQTGSGNITVDVSPSLLLANGTDTSAVTIAVRDADNQPATDGTVIKLTAGEKFEDVDGNGYWTQGIDSLIYDANSDGMWNSYGVIPSTATTSGGTGNATVNFISGNDAVTVYIRATVDDNGITGYAETALQMNPNANIAFIYLTSDSMRLVVKGTGGMETGTLHAHAYDEYGQAVPEGLPITFSIIDGPGGGEHLGNTGTGPYTSLTNSQGIASCPISSGTVSGTVRLYASSDTVVSSNAFVLISAGPPVDLDLGVEELNVPYWNTVNEQVDVVAVVSDVYRNPVVDSTVVYFTVDEGTVKSHEERTKDQNGTAMTVWISNGDEVGDDGRVYLIAETYGGTVADTVMFYNSYITNTITCPSPPTSIRGNGVDKLYFYVYGTDLNGNPVDDPTDVEVRASYLGVTDNDFDDDFWDVAQCEIEVISTTLEEDFSLTGGNDDGIGAVDNILITSGGGFLTVPINILTGNAYSENCEVKGPTNLPIGESGRFEVIIKDRFSNPLGDHTVIMSASAGTVVSSTHETGGYGDAIGFNWTAPGVAGKYVITFYDSDPNGGIYLTHEVTVE